MPGIHPVFERIDLNLLSVFDVVMVERHVTRAAERLGMTQSAVSNSLNRLRKLFGDQLFVKSASGVEPTPRAIELWPHVHKSIHDLISAIRPANFLPASHRGKYRLGCGDLMASLLAPALNEKFRQEAPDAAVQIVPNLEGLISTRLSRGEMDFAVDIAIPSTSVLEHIPLWSDQFVVAGRRGHPLLARSVSLKALCSAEHVIVNATGSDKVTDFDNALASRGLERKIRWSVNQFSVLLELLVSSDLVAVVPAHLAIMPSARDKIALRVLPLEMNRLVMYLIWHRRNNSDPRCLWFKQLMLSVTPSFDRRLKGLVR